MINANYFSAIELAGDYDINNLPLLDLGILAEANLEKKLAMCALLFPAETLSLCKDIKFRIDSEAKKFWEDAQKIREQILEADNDQAYQFIFEITPDLSISLRWWFEFQKDYAFGKDINPADRIMKYMFDLEATRGTAIWLQHVQENNLLVPSMG